MEEEELGMSLFDSAEGLQINMDVNPEELEDIAEPEGTEGEEGNEAPEETEGKDIDINLDEDESSEKVVGEEGEEEGESDSDKDDISPNIYSSFASVLNEQGLLPSLDLLDKKIENADDLTEVFKSEISNQVKEYLLGKVGEKGYEALEKGISLAEYQEYEDNIQTLSGISEDSLETDLELSKKLIYQDYVSQGLSEKRAAAILKKSIDLGDEQIIADAKESLESLKAVEALRLEKAGDERQAQAKVQKQQQEQIDNDLKNSIYNTKEFIPGIKANKAIQDTVYNSITKVVGKSPEGIMENQLMRDRRENPVDFDSKMYYLYEITKGFKDFSKIVTRSESSAVRNLEDQLRKTKFQDSGTPAYLQDPESYGGVGSELVI
tara:strand:- start:1740 stop:2876 length:1137 start_codon:yes stop_codon:yes gene_type:complete